MDLVSAVRLLQLKKDLRNFFPFSLFFVFEKVDQHDC